MRVKFEIGSVATPFNRQSLAKSMADCQRYWQQVRGHVRFYASNAPVTTSRCRCSARCANSDCR